MAAATSMNRVFGSDTSDVRSFEIAPALVGELIAQEAEDCFVIERRWRG